MSALRVLLALAAAALTATVPATASAAPFELPLPIPKVLTGANLDIQMQESEVQLRPGKKTKMWTYGGSFPGPTIRRPSNTTTRVRFRNDLPASAGSMSVHHHGAHSASTEDGQPHEEPGAAPGGLLIPPGGAREYTWTHVEDGGPERAAFQWYHDHRMDVTGRNVWNGMAGMVILDDPVDQALPLPKGEYDVPLMIVDRKLDENNQLSYPEDLLQQGPGMGGPPSDGETGDVLLVNGAAQPHFEVADRKYRLRLLNASNFRTLELRLADGSPMTQVATESGLLPAPVDRGVISLGPAERAEVVVDFRGLRDKSVTLTSTAGDVMQFRVTKSAPEPDRSYVPSVLRPAPQLEDTPVTRQFNFGLAFDAERGRMAWTVNGRVYDHERIDAVPRRGSTETWQLTNVGSSGVPHYIHIHLVDWQIVSRNGKPPPAWERGLKETVLVRPEEVVVVRARFADYKGPFVFHCHMLEHEDNGMMANYAVADDSGDTTPNPPLQAGSGDEGGAVGGGRGAGGAGPTPETLPGVRDPLGATAGLSVRFAGAPRSVRSGRRQRWRVQVVNSTQRTAARVRARVVLPVGFRRVRGRKVLRVRSRVVRMRRLGAGRTRSFTVAARAPDRLRSRRVRLRASVTGYLDRERVTDTDTLSYRVRRGRTRTGATASASSAGSSFVCVLGS